MEEGALVLTDKKLDVTAEPLTNNRPLDGNRDCFISILNNRLGCIATATGDLLIFRWASGKQEIHTINTVGENDAYGEQWTDIVPLKSQGGWVLTNSFLRTVMLHPNGTRNHFAQSFNNGGEEGRQIRVSDDERHIGYIVGYDGYGSVKVFPEFATKGHMDDLATYIRFYENDEDASDKSINDFRFMSNDRVIGCTSFGVIAVHQLTQDGSKEVCHASVSPNQDYGVDSIRVSKDEKLVWAIASAQGEGEREHLLAVFSFDGSKLELLTKVEVSKKCSTPCLIGTYESADGQPMLVASVEKSTANFYSFNTEAKKIEFVHQNSVLTADGPRHGCIAEGYIWVVDCSGAVIRLKTPGL